MTTPLETPNPFLGRKVTLSLGFIIVSIVYALWQHFGGPSAALSLGGASPTSVSPAQSYKAANDALLQTLAQIHNPAPATPSPQTQPQPTVTTPVMPKRTGLYADGSYTGSAADAYYGTVQVKAIVKNGQIADVQFLQYPSDRSNSRYINSQAMPLLTQEAIQAQSANVSGVSGATFTSQAFQESLTAALALAKN